jgi:sortase A
MSGWRWLERALLIGGLVAVDVWVWSHAITAVWQGWDSHMFDRMRQEQPRVEMHPARHEDLVGRLTIPRLHLSAMVREGTDEATLARALGHVAATALPGQPGNVCVAGHRDTLFRPLRQIHKDDVIQFETSGGSFVYQVESMHIVSPRDVSVLKRSSWPELTLVTCYPFNYIGSAPDRFIVKARQITGKSATNVGG